MTHTGRVRHLIALGQRADAEMDVAETLRAMSEGGFYERFLALTACSGSRDGAAVLRCLSDESQLIRGLAISLVSCVCDDTQTVAALEALPQEARTVLLRRLWRRRRHGAIDTFLDRTAPTAESARAVPLGLGLNDLVRRHLGVLRPGLGLSDWQRLARLHPDLTAETLTAEADMLDEADARLLTQVNAILPILADSRPDSALRLVQAVLKTVPPSRLSLQCLVPRRPDAIADLLLASEDRAQVQFSRAAHRLKTERLQRLVQQRPETLGNPSSWLKRVPPAERLSVFEAAGRGWRDTEGALPIVLAALLPGETRRLEARRCMALPALATRPAQRLPYAALLPWEEAKAALEASIRSPDAELRAVALAALVGAARYDQTRLGDALTLTLRRNNEQDPVRRALIAALAALPSRRWTAEHLEDLGQTIRDALSAADLSTATAGAAEKLVVDLVPFHPEWAAQWLGTLAQERGQVHLYGLGDRLNDADVRRIAPALLPVFRSWETRERESFIVQAAHSLGRRLRVFDALVEILERVAGQTRQNYVASQILSLLAKHRPGRLPALIPSLVKADPSAATLPVVYTYLHRHRQNLITPFLGQKAYGGRFSTGKTRFVLPLRDGFERWTPSQQKTFAETLDRVTRDTARDTPSIFGVIHQLAALPAVAPTRLIELAELGADKAAVRDAALRALARLDGGQGIPTLLEALDDSRARIAIYALRTALLEMPAPRALAILRGVPTDKVTVAKEVIRLLGELKTPDAYPVLLALNGQTLHRDVRVALLRALWDHLDRIGTWPILDKAAVDPDPAVAGGVVRIPTDRLSPSSQGRLLSLLARLLEHPDPKVRLDVLARCVQLPLRDSRRLLLPRLLGCMASRLPDESTAGARAVFATYSGAEASAVGEAVHGLGANRRALQAAVDALSSNLTWNRGTLRPTVRAVLEALEGDGGAASLRTGLAVAGLLGDELTPWLTRLAERGDLHAEALMTAAAGLAGSAARPDDRDTLEADLAAQPDERLRRLALSVLVGAARTTPGWSEERLARLEVYRRDPSPLVAGAAGFTFPPDSEETS